MQSEASRERNPSGKESQRPQSCWKLWQSSSREAERVSEEKSGNNRRGATADDFQRVAGRFPGCCPCGVIVQGGIILGGIPLRGNCPGGDYLGEGGGVVQGGDFRGGIVLEASIVIKTDKQPHTLK